MGYCFRSQKNLITFWSSVYVWHGGMCESGSAETPGSSQPEILWWGTCMVCGVHLSLSLQCSFKRAQPFVSAEIWYFWWPQSSAGELKAKLQGCIKGWESKKERSSTRIAIHPFYLTCQSGQKSSPHSTLLQCQRDLGIQPNHLFSQGRIIGLQWGEVTSYDNGRETAPWASNSDSGTLA